MCGCAERHSGWNLNCRNAGPPWPSLLKVKWRTTCTVRTVQCIRDCAGVFCFWKLSHTLSGANRYPVCLGKFETFLPTLQPKCLLALIWLGLVSCSAIDWKINILMDGTSLCKTWPCSPWLEDWLTICENFFFLFIFCVRATETVFVSSIWQYWISSFVQLCKH